MIWLIIAAVLVFIGWAVFVWAVCSISSIADRKNYELLLFQEGLDNGETNGQRPT